MRRPSDLNRKHPNGFPATAMRGLILVLAACSPLLAASAVAVPAASPQAPAARAVPPTRRVTGRVVHPEGQRLAPVGGEWVTLHRVGSDTAGPVDSMRTSSDGQYAFTYHPWGASDAVYFVSASYDGVAYLSQPLTEAVVTGPAAEITVYDTTSRTVPLRVRGRHLVVGAPNANGLRAIIEVFELSNDTSVTAVSPSSTGDHPTWSIALPEGARQFAVGQGDVAADAVGVIGGRVSVFAPFAPGLKQLSFSYALPASAFPLVRAMPAGAIVLEVLVEETGAQVSGPGIREVAPVAAEGRTFRRFLAQDLPAGAAVRITVPVVASGRRTVYITAIAIAVGVVMLGALGVAFTRRT